MIDIYTVLIIKGFTEKNIVSFMCIFLDILQESNIPQDP